MIQFPDCVLTVTKFEEMKHRNMMFGCNDPAFSFDKTFMADMWFGNMMNMDGVAFRTIQWSTWDQLKQFTLVDIQHRWNYASHQLYVIGHDPSVNVFCGLMTKAPVSDLYDNIWVRKWVSAHCKLAAYRLMTYVQTTYIGGVTINLQAFTDEANKDIEDCKTKFAEFGRVPRIYKI